MESNIARQGCSNIVSHYPATTRLNDWARRHQKQESPSINYFYHRLHKIKEVEWSGVRTKTKSRKEFDHTSLNLSVLLLRRLIKVQCCHKRLGLSITNYDIVQHAHKNC